MIKIQEVTEWGDSTPNHTYLVSDDKSVMYGYIKQGTTKMISTPRMNFDKRKRKFVKVK